MTSNSTRPGRSPAWAEFLGRHARAVIALAIVATAVLTVPFLTMQPDENASQEPGGIVFDARDAIDERFVSAVYPVPVITEARGGDILEQPALAEVLARSKALRANPDLGPTLFTYFDVDTGREVVGLQTIADLVDERIPGGLAAATQAHVDAAVAGLIDEYGARSDVLGLSVQTAFNDAAGRWVSPALSTQVLADNDVLGFGNLSITLGGETAPEEFSREVVAELRGTQEMVRTWGVAIDVNLTSEEQGATAGPFIGFTILAVLLIVGLTFRSYWVLAITGAALGSLIIWLKGISNLIGLKDDLILTLIVPIAMISFGVDFAFHAVGRYREERNMGMAPRRAFVVGLSAVAGALVLALASDTAAFAANAAAGIESIVQFGIGAAIALVAAFLLLGFVTPLAVSVVEGKTGTPPATRARSVGRIAASLGAGMTLMASVLLMVYVFPAGGVVLLAMYVVAFTIAPYLLSRGHAAQPEGAAATGPGRLARATGIVIAAVAARRRIVVPVVGAVTLAAALLAVQVPTVFDVKDFFTADSDFVVGLDKLDEHVGDLDGEPASIYVAAPLNNPIAVGAVAAFADDVAALDSTRFARDEEGAIRVDGGMLGVIDDTWSSPAAQAALTEATGVQLTDGDGNGIPDDAAQLEALYAFTRQTGVPFDETRLIRTPNDVQTSIWVSEDGSEYATLLQLSLPDSRQQESVVAARADLEPLVAELETALQALDAESQAVFTGSPVVRQAALEGISRALQVSLPIAVLLCFLIAALFMRSIRLALVTVVPILMTVAWLYGFMEVFGFGINIVTATIGAVSIGIGIDFAIHFTMRYREELAVSGRRTMAVEAAGVGTGTALIASAISSAVGFGILALAPMPLFASYGFLTAVMIVMALTASLFVLPSLLMLVTSDAVETAEQSERAVGFEPAPQPARA